MQFLEEAILKIGLSIDIEKNHNSIFEAVQSLFMPYLMTSGPFTYVHTQEGIGTIPEAYSPGNN